MQIRSALVVDPAGESTTVVASALASAGVQVRGVAGYGLEALELSFASEPQLVFVRIDDPAARPLELIRRLHDALPDVPLIAVLNHLPARVASAGIAAGALTCLEEPLKPQPVLAAVRLAQRSVDRRRHVPEGFGTPGGDVIAVLGPGGVGKTTLATNLAIAIQHASHGQVILVDADPLFGDVGLALDIASGLTVAGAVEELGLGQPLREWRDSITSIYGISVVPALHHGVRRNVSPEALTALIDVLHQAYDFVVVDTPGVVTELSSAVVSMASRRVLVTIPETSSVRHAAGALRDMRAQLGQRPDHAQILCNRVGLKGGLSLDEVSRETGVPVKWAIEDDRHVLKAVQVGIPVVESFPRSRSARSIEGVATELAGLSNPGDPKPPRGWGHALVPRWIPVHRLSTY